MNYLVHCWLGRVDPGLRAGGFLGDFIKGTLNDSIPLTLRRGLELHRHIDLRSNHMVEMKSTYHRFGPNLRRVAPILLDLMADHVFAKHWREFGDGDLCEFTQLSYRDISFYEIPPNAQRMYNHMIGTDLFARYADLEVMEGVMGRILDRLRFGQFRLELTSLVRNQTEEFLDDFRSYFPLLECEANQFVEKIEQDIPVDSKVRKYESRSALSLNR